MSLTHGGPEHKASIRSKVWKELREVALPDSRFHDDFSNFITDFDGSRDANDRLMELPVFKSSTVIFITPDNCLEYLREKTLEAGKSILMTTYGIRRGFWYLDPAEIDSSLYKYASTLDGMEKVGKAVSLHDMNSMSLNIELAVTGTGAVNEKGIRFGKGHGYFDLEWGMLYSSRSVSTKTVVASVVHDCQVLQEELIPEEFDTVCDVIATPTKLIEVKNVQKPTCGIVWDKLADGMLEAIPPLQELHLWALW